VRIVSTDDEREACETRHVRFCGLCAISESDSETESESDFEEDLAGVQTERAPLVLETANDRAAQVRAVSSIIPSHIHIDTAANVNVCSPDLLSELEEANETLAAFQGMQFPVTHKGVLNIVVKDECDSSKMHTLRIKMYAMKGVEEPIVSWESMAAGGAELRLKSGGSTIAFNDSKNTVLRIGVDGRMKVARILGDDDGWKVAGRQGKAPIKSALSAHPRFPAPVREKRFAPRGGVRSIRSGQGN
jgi:hypothetical protein